MASPMAPPMQAPMGGGGGFLKTMADGLMFGTGSAVAHRVVDGIMGPRTVVHEHTGAAAAPASDAPAAASSMAPAAAAAPVAASSTGEMQACSLERVEFERCMRNNNSNMEACKSIYDVLFSCQQTMNNFK